MTLLRKKIFIHDSVIDPIHQRGVDRCFRNYSQALENAFPEQVWVYSKQRKDIFPKSQFYPPSTYLRYPTPYRIRYYSDNVFGEFIANAFSKVYYSPYYGEIKTRVPQIFSVHDMIHEKYPKYFSGDEGKRFIEEKKACFERAASILCVSQNTATDILELYPNIPESKIRILYNGVDDFFMERISTPYIGKPYFLYVGNRGLYKNFERLLVAFGKSNLSKEYDLRLITPNEGFPSETEKDLLTRYHLEHSIKVEISVSDSILRERYNHAFAYVCPSLYEGFGLPLLEAMSCGTLTLAANGSSLPEVGGDVSLYFDPNSEDSIISTLLLASTLSTDDRKDRIERGIARSSLFAWNIAKEKFIDIIKSFL